MDEDASPANSPTSVMTGTATFTAMMMTTTVAMSLPSLALEGLRSLTGSAAAGRGARRARRRLAAGSSTEGAS